MAVASRLQIRTNDEVFQRPHVKSRRERTLEVGPKRVEKVKQALRELQQLGNPQNHDIRPSEVDKIEEQLTAEIEALMYVLRNPGKQAPAPGIFERD